MKKIAGWVLSRPFQRIMFWLFFIFICIVIVFSLVPAQDDIPGANDVFSLLSSFIFGTPEMGDKIAHFIAYASVGATAVWGKVRLFGRVSITLLGLVLMGACLEFAQGSFAYRDPDFLDFVANGIGVFIGLCCASLVIGISQRLAPV